MKKIIIVFSIVLFLVIVICVSSYLPHLGSFLIIIPLILLFTFIEIKLVRNYKIYVEGKKGYQIKCYIILIIINSICLLAQVSGIISTSSDLIKGPQEIKLYDVNITLKTEKKLRGGTGNYYKLVGMTADNEKKTIVLKNYKSIKIEDVENIIKEKQKSNNNEFIVYYYEKFNLVYSIE